MSSSDVNQIDCDEISRTNRIRSIQADCGDDDNDDDDDEDKEQSCQRKPNDSNSTLIRSTSPPPSQPSYSMRSSASSSSSSSTCRPSAEKEEIRRRLAFDDDDPIAQYKLSNRKSQKSLQSRLKNLDSLQICFLNEQNNRIYYLLKKLQKVDFDLDKVDLFVDIEKPCDQSRFSEYHSKLYTEAKLTLSQIKEICKLRLKLDKENEEISSIYKLIHNFPSDFLPGSSKLTQPILNRLRIDELYMEQDSLLIDIEDLNKFL
ncbi:ablim [Sarcoptes scabiei]|nr:ablim [Sarcoptes scabiei]